MTNDQQVAVWTARYATPHVEVFDSERQAADYAAAIADSGNATVVGAQFPDGRTIPAERWEAYAGAKDRLLARQKEWAERSAANPPARRRIQAPFGLGDADIDPDEPGWLGV